MFTGIVETTGQVSAVQPTEEGVRLAITSSLDLSRTRLGDSIAVDGVCLTVVGLDGAIWEADISHETLRCTTLGERAIGDVVHLEKALCAGDPLGGHMVQGHVDCVGERTACEARGECWDLEYTVPADQAAFIVDKGSVAIDGVSLTVNWCRGDRFGVTLIPHTADVTHLVDAREQVNVETDIVGKYVVETTRRMQSGGSEQ